MQLKNELLREHSKNQCVKIVTYVGDSQARFDELANLFLGPDPLIAQRAAWPLSYCAIAQPALVSKHLKKIINNLAVPGIHDAVKRNTMRFLQHTDIPSTLQGNVINICFEYLAHPKEAVAIKAFSLSVLCRLAFRYPEIVPEIKMLIEDQLTQQSPGFKARAKKVLKRLKAVAKDQK